MDIDPFEIQAYLTRVQEGEESDLKPLFSWTSLAIAWALNGSHLLGHLFDVNIREHYGRVVTTASISVSKNLYRLKISMNIQLKGHAF